MVEVKAVLEEAGNHEQAEEEDNIVRIADAIQVMTGCTFGKGNLIFKDYGKQVYTFIRRPSGDAIRVSIDWKSPEETPEKKRQCGNRPPPTRKFNIK